MWDPGTAFLAVVVVAGAAVLAPPIARITGGFCAIIGLLGVIQDRTWAPTVAALGVLAWLIGHWSFAVRNDARYRSPLARALFDQTPLRWTLPQSWSARKRRR
ncbi:hypothetical protein [Hoyosella subflava]|uniref:Uncharacterized protein n=1 Tax=Hoyosella subflava (strain DSM 45089 / JCM 17490 / NBRC 109087 / DQS3-9A1) TaxID=443218 RepID=F6EL42_HOYSD|nr:hypothetical protein [Hoyosella subflava]AEF42705.1 hypothetical protein AS9A_4272 [Hoyosella subflava DQS3-9A1]